MFHFLLGVPGSGKTQYIKNKIRENVEKGKKTFLLVPEQQLFISQCMLADLPPASALCFEIVSFSRLCELVFETYGGLIDTRASSGARNLIMWKNLREISGNMVQYKGITPDSAFAEMMLSTIDELKVNSISPEDCENAAKICQSQALAAKLSDISLIYANYERITEQSLGESAMLAENKLVRLAKLLSTLKCLENCSIFIDSFTDFTGEQYAVLEQIISQAENTYVALPYIRGSREPHTVTLRHTVQRLTRYLNEGSIAYEDIVLNENKRTDNKALIEIQNKLWDFSVRRDTISKLSPEDTNSIEMYSCNNEYEEIWLVALNILKNHSLGIKYSEMAVIMRNMEGRKGIVDAVFEQLGIPFFYSDRTDLSSTPLARLIISALRCISRNFNFNDVISILKTGLLKIDEHDADLFEEYCYTWQISGKTFTDGVWSMNPDGYTVEMSERGKEILKSANLVREIIIPPLLELKRDFTISNGNTAENCKALYNYLEKIHLSDRLSSLAEFSLSAGNTKEAGEILRLYDFLVTALTDICNIMSDIPTTADDIACAVDITFKNTDIASVPSVNDYVTIGSAAMLRVENISVAMLIGLCDGEFPASFSDNSILCENDKKEMDEIGLSLTSREETINSDELFFVYRAMTKPSQRLILSTCKSSIGGQELKPSSAWNRVKFLIPSITEKHFDLDRVRNIAYSERSGKEINRSSESQYESNDYFEVSPEFARKIFGDRLYLSKSKISSFAQCPYKYWSEKVLNLREQKVSAIGYNDAGTIIHYVLENLLRELKNDRGQLENISEELLIAEVDRLLRSYIDNINCPLFSYTMYSFSRLRDLSLILAKSVIDEFSSSKFRIVAMEKVISDKKDDALRPMEIKVDDTENSPTVVLGGVIDRIDCYEGEDKNYIRIIDYKTGAQNYDPDAIADGEDLQLPAYLFTASLKENQKLFNRENGKDSEPVSAMFVCSKETKGKIQPSRSGFILQDEEILKATNENMDPEYLAGISFDKKGEIKKNKAAVSRDDIRIMQEELTSTVANTAQSIYSGEIPKTPSENACKFCIMKSFCSLAK